MGLYTAVLVLCCISASATAMSSEVFNAKAIKGTRNSVPAEEILTLIRPVISQKEETYRSKIEAKEVLRLISDLGFSNSSTGKKYYINKVALTWVEAWANCTRLGQQFATVNSAEEELQLVSQIITEGLTDTMMFIGGNDLASEGHWTWVNGNCNSTVKEYYWTDGQPNNMNNDQHCLGVQSGGWNDLWCYYSYYYVCQSNVF